MASTNPARGMRDFLPADVRKREYVIGIIKEVYESYGFEPLETPAVENIETLMGKYGEEGNQLIYKILKRGDKLAESLKLTEFTESENSENSVNSQNSVNSLSDLALRYDLTVPLARVVANNKNELPKFFKRYQIQPVWRADRPARGRYREFYQCDVDVIGSSSTVVEVELISAFTQILEKLGFDDFIIRLNHRGILTALLESVGIPQERWIECLVIMDKGDKIGAEGVVKEFAGIGLSKEFQSIAKFIGLVHSHRMKKFHNFDSEEKTPKDFSWESYNDFVIEELSRLIDHANQNAGLQEIKTILSLPSSVNGGRIEIVPILARGLSYYTGCIMEIVLADTTFPVSLAGGGRYDGLIGMFGKEQIPACGFSLGLERILVVMEERGMFPPEIAESTPADVMVTIWNEESIGESLKLANELRSNGIRVTLYPEPDKLGKQIKYADSIKVPYVCVLGESELADGKVTLKNMRTGEQQTLERTAVADALKK
jgi:histidyl-tRNA synthetase